MKKQNRGSEALALAIPATVQPKPRKEDIINALVERARVKHEAEAKALKERREKALDNLNHAVKSHFWANPSKWTDKVTVWNSRVEIEFCCADVPAKIKALQQALNEIPSIRGFDTVEVKRRIRVAIGYDKGAAVKALLGNAEMVQKLDQTLEDLGT